MLPRQWLWQSLARSTSTHHQAPAHHCNGMVLSVASSDVTRQINHQITVNPLRPAGVSLFARRALCHPIVATQTSIPSVCVPQVRHGAPQGVRQHSAIKPAPTVGVTRVVRSSTAQLGMLACDASLEELVTR
jgi:hypothetical protein